MGDRKGKWSRRSAGQWRSLLAKFAGNGMGVEAFCRREAISAASFCRWRKLLAAEGGLGGGLGSETAPAFVDLGTPNTAWASRGRIDRWLDLGEGLSLHLVQSLIIACRLHGIDPHDYLADVLQRVGQHPASRVHELTPRLWKSQFAGNPLRSPQHTLRE